MDIFRPAASAHSLKVALEPPDRALYWSRVLDASEDELRQVIGQVGCRAHRVCARLWEMRQGRPPEVPIRLS
jgi:hypothetical protein